MPLSVSLPRGGPSQIQLQLYRTQITRLFGYCLRGFASIQVFVESCVCLCVRRVAGLCVCIHYLCSMLDQKQLCFPWGSALACHRVCARVHARFVRWAASRWVLCSHAVRRAPARDRRVLTLPPNCLLLKNKHRVTISSAQTDFTAVTDWLYSAVLSSSQKKSFGK